MSKPTTERPTIKRHWLRPLLRRVDFITTTLNSAYAFLGEICRSARQLDFECDP